ncbi:glycosyltransferase [Acinetobacter sp. YH01020]|uniref:glycosyltransferase family 2 protein n=1 Tax=Acinetobacter sp. YH01020 TaxID=2601034 RepID=UPI0015D3A5A7|nr:glycosyltransferase [Acinetobacter sp. YH01020]
MENDNQPLVSVVIACYNHEHFVQDCIQSIIDQTYENIELIIIDDGSKDRSVEKIQEMIPACKQRFVRFEFRYRPNKGLSATLNEALEWCEGTYFSPIASDDILLIKKLEKQVFLMEANTTCKGIFGNMILIDDKNKEYSYDFKEEKKFFFKDLFKYSEYLPAPTQILRLNDIKSIGGYNEKFIIEDWYIYLKLIEKGGYFLRTEDFFTKYRSHADNLSKKRDLMVIGKLQIADYFRQYEEDANKLIMEVYLFAFIKILISNPLLMFRIFFEKIVRRLRGYL